VIRLHTGRIEKEEGSMDDTVSAKQGLTQQRAKGLLESRGYKMRIVFDHLHAIDTRHREFHLCMEEQLATMSADELLKCLNAALRLIHDMEFGYHPLSRGKQILVSIERVKRQIWIKRTALMTKALCLAMRKRSWSVLSHLYRRRMVKEV
jgi:hypothetical protein